MLAVAILYVVILSVESASEICDCAYPAKAGNQADYYWREYFGIVPRDAIPGGYTVDGNVTYIGQIPHEKHVGVYPGVINAWKEGCMICPGERYVDKPYVKILCSNPHNKFEWTQTTADTAPLLTDYHWVIGGYHYSGTIFYIGRVRIEGEVQVGRVFDPQSPYKGLWVCNKAGTQVNFKSFELLVLSR